MVALVAPAVATALPKHEQNNGRVSYNERPANTAPPADRVELASPTPASHGREFFVVDPELGTFGRLELEATKGRVDVRRVTVAFTDGTTRKFSLDRSLVKARVAEIDLGGARQIDQIVITTDREPNGKYALYGVHGSSGTGVATR